MALTFSGVTITGGWNITGSDGPSVTPTVEYLVVAGGGSGGNSGVNGGVGGGGARSVWNIIGVRTGGTLRKAEAVVKHVGDFKERHLTTVFEVGE